MTFGFSKIRYKAELDLMVRVRGEHYGFEIKYADAPGSTRSMQIALNDLALEHLWVVYPGQHEYALHDRITAPPLQALLGLAASWQRRGSAAQAQRLRLLTPIPRDRLAEAIHV